MVQCGVCMCKSSLHSTWPLPLHKTIKEALVRMESLQVVSKIDEPTTWCAEMVIGSKNASEWIHICVDFWPLKDGVLREVHPKLWLY